MTNKREIIGAGVAALLAGIGIFIWLAAAHDSAQLVSVLAARSDLAAPKIIRPEDVGYIKVPRASLPKGAATKGAEVIGKALVHSLGQNQIITARDVTRGRGENSDALLVPASMVGMVVPSSWLAGPLPRVKAHDLVSLFVAIPLTKGSAGGAAEVVRAAEVLATQGDKDGAPQGVLLALSPQEAQRLLQLKATQLQLLLVVESAEETSLPASFSTSTF